jgi:hypothetical protein
MQCVLDMFRLLTFIFLVILNRGTCHNEAVFRKIKGKYLRDYVYTTMKTTNELHCTTTVREMGHVSRLISKSPEEIAVYVS